LHREILRHALLPPRGQPSLKEHLLAMPGAGGDEAPERRLLRLRRS
jgi:hypothetical protein